MERTQVLQIRISPDEKERITCNAELAGMKPAAYVRSMALHAKDERQTEAEENESFKKTSPPSGAEASAPSASPAETPDQDSGSPGEVNSPVARAGSTPEAEREAEFKQRVNRHALRMSRRKAEAIVKKEMGLDASP